MMHIRKVSYTTRTTNQFNSKTKTVPYIRMSGKWLEELGFAIGSQFSIIKESADDEKRLTRIVLEPINQK